jgi:hypothetical protein
MTCPSDFDAFERIVTALGVACREELDVAAKRTYFGLLRDVPLNLLGRGARLWVEQGHERFPSVGAWRRVVDEAQASAPDYPVYRALRAAEEPAATNPGVFAKIGDLLTLGRKLHADHVPEREIQRIVHEGVKAAFPEDPHGPRVTFACFKCEDTGFRTVSGRPAFVEFCPCRLTNPSWQAKQAPVRTHYSKAPASPTRKRVTFESVGNL